MHECMHVCRYDIYMKSCTFPYYYNSVYSKPITGSHAHSNECFIIKEEAYLGYILWGLCIKVESPVWVGVPQTSIYTITET